MPQSLKADLHTHTVASGHAYSTITENLEAAHQAGLELIAVTDHGPCVPQGAHAWYFWNLREMPGFYKGVTLLKGCEANLITPAYDRWGNNNGLDLPNELLEFLDFVEVGFHSHCGFDDALDVERNTQALLRVMANPFVDQVNHPGNFSRFPVDIDRVVEAAERYNVILECNNHSFDPHGSHAGTERFEADFAAAAYAARVPIAIGSDTHYCTQVGGQSEALAATDALGIERDYFVNASAESVKAHLEAKRPRPLWGLGPHVK